ncbi:ADP-ribosylglycohydrolase-domain-containing protein [Pyrenochaeta sp. MPI-SDFR-AT-0127]|nr:ADP-ribosylglycohydrolase-domain-containing protein [Pyrenochaeta sp. MPI-SDFR-AT-0127]
MDAHPFVHQMVMDKVYGCIIGSALGDTIGLYTEFLTKEQSAQVYPDPKFRLIEPATEFHPDSHRLRFGRCAWTDDTDQALLIVLGYLHAHTSTPSTLSVKELSQDFAVRLNIWISQGLLALDRYACGIGALVGGTVQSKNYLDDPVGTATQRWVHSGRYQAPNGSLMRTHPIGVIGVGMSEVETFELSVGIGRTTHVDPRCVVSCCIEVALIRGLIRGEILNEKDVDACIERSYDWVKGQPEIMNPGLDEELTKFEIERHIERKEFERHVYAKTLDDLKLDEHNKIGYVYKCLGSAIVLLRLAMRKTAVLSVASGPPAAETVFENLVVDLIMEGGDADTNGAAAAALLGAYLGYAKLPSHWTLGLAHKEWLIQKTGRLAIASGVAKGFLQPEKDEASDGGVGLRTSKELDHRWALLVADISKKMNDAREKAANTKEKKKGIAGWFAN